MGLLKPLGMVYVGISTIAVGVNLLRNDTQRAKRIAFFVMVLNLGILGLIFL